MITIILVDDHALVREGLRRLLQDCPDLQVIGEAGDGHEALRLTRKLQPQVVVMDLSMPELDGMETTKRMVNEGLPAKVLILTMHANEEYAIRVLQAGACGFIGKGSPTHEVVDAIRKVAAGGYALPPGVAEDLPRRYLSKDPSASPLGTLSDRELQVLKHLAEGHTSREIAQELHLSAKTVDTYRARLLTKLNLNTTADLIRFALRYGVIENAW